MKEQTYTIKNNIENNNIKFERYEISILENGLRIISETIPHFRSISLGFWIPAGSRNETPEINGITHLIEHLLFKGTTNRTYKEIAIEFDSMGAEFNAFTDKENSCVYADFIDSHLDKCIEILFDVVTSPSFLPESIKLEKKVVLEELKMVKDNPSDEIFNYFYEVVFNGHPLGLPILGTKKSINLLDFQTIQQYFKNNFNLNKMVISAAGNVKHKVLVELVKSNIEKISDKISFNNNNKKDLETSLNYIKKKKLYKSKTQTSHLCLGGPGCSRKSSDKYALSLFTNILGGSISSRLFQKVREEKGLSYTIFASNTQYTDTGIIAIYAAASHTNLQRVIDLIISELKLIQKNGINTYELEIAKENTKGAIVLGVEDISSRMFRLGKALLIDGNVLTINEILKKIDATSIEKVNEIADKYFNPDKLSIVVISKNTNTSNIIKK